MDLGVILSDADEKLGNHVPYSIRGGQKILSSHTWVNNFIVNNEFKIYLLLLLFILLSFTK